MSNIKIDLRKLIKIGLDIGSTTVKIVILNAKDVLIYSNYLRHYSEVRETVYSMLQEVCKNFMDYDVQISITGSGGILISQNLNLNFIQEVIAGKIAIEKCAPSTNVAIEIGGEDVKIIYFAETTRERMNNICAGGTGSFIDQTASLLNTDAEGLNLLAKNYITIYPIAARCGVFAKTDIQSLLNEGVRKEDIAVSIFQAIVNQIISTLTYGNQLKGNIAFLGGPLNYLSELRNRFIEVLNLSPSQVYHPENAHLFIAYGAALGTINNNTSSMKSIFKKLDKLLTTKSKKFATLQPLFTNDIEMKLFQKRHAKIKAPCNSLTKYTGKCFLGLDVGSTTTKAVLIDDRGKILFSYYCNNNGNPIETTFEILSLIYNKLPINTYIANTAVIGYGEDLIKNAFGFDLGIVETIAHYKAAIKFMPDVEFILDIGGQDMKFLKIKNGLIVDVILNEACSSGCGSFLETFAKSLNITMKEFIKEALKSEEPMDLGSKCTVFMNSKVRQAQVDGGNIGDIAAGLSYSVIKNALFKVIKLKHLNNINGKIIVQGGTFYNDAVLRSFELLLGKEVIRPDIAGLMGAYGASITAMEKYIPDYQSNLISKTAMESYNYSMTIKRCKSCQNNCLLTVSKFPNNKQFTSGNKCDSFTNKLKENKKLYNLCDYKYQRLFSYKPLAKNKPIRGTIGIPRALNIYENYPFWFAFFTKLNYRVLLSDESSDEIYQMGFTTLSSESICYPAKLANGHIINLLKKDVDIIFYPGIPYEINEIKGADNHYNCPIVTSYSEVIKNNINMAKDKKITFLNPFLPYNNKRRLTDRLFEEFNKFSISKPEIKSAVNAGWKEMLKFKKDIQKKGEEVINYLNNSGKKGIVLSGKPYHLDGKVNHGIPNIINNLGYSVLTEDSISHLGKIDRPIRVLDQWMYNSRQYSAAAFVANNKNLDLIQLISFGCVIDAVASDQVEEILKKNNKIYTVLKIDEINNLAAYKVRIRSLIATTQMRERLNTQKKFHPIDTWKTANSKVKSANEKASLKIIKKSHTILAADMSPIHFDILAEAFRSSGYRIVIPPINDKSIGEGLKYVNNDACYPAIIIVGQLITALKSGNYDLNNTSLMLTQTGGGCIASNYNSLLKKALTEANLGHIPIVSLNVCRINKDTRFKITYPFVKKAIIALIYGDLLMKVLCRTRPYEKIKGSAELLTNYWIKKCKLSVGNGNYKEFKDYTYQIVKDFDNLELNKIDKPKVGIVGEIFLKYHPVANNNIIELLENEGMEVLIPDLTIFLLYLLFDGIANYKYLDGTAFESLTRYIGIYAINKFQVSLKEALSNSKRFSAPHNIYQLAAKSEKILSNANNTGEGWLLTAEILDLLDNDVNNIISIQPFTCLPNHITEKGVLQEIKHRYPKSNIISLDYDPLISEVNQLNRIKLALFNKI